ncbi:MAG: hypothetical protein KDA37_17105 [Planctomycetales bacterium]|nr:hypothetical protein [Planctomycetales bacterium]
MSPARPFAILAALLLPLGSAASALAATFPYQATVAAPSASVFAGPGEQYYVAAELPPGAAVEVYEETASGFCAVRPPEGSFSLITAADVRIDEDGVGVITRDQAPSRVGSLLHARRDAVHVRLNKGERVRVLGEQVVDGVRWLQIAPPSGEFRWLRKSDLTTAQHSPASSALVSVSNTWVQAAAHTQETKDSEPDAPSAVVIGATPQPLTPAPPLASVNAAEPRDSAAPKQVVLTGPFAQQMSQLEIELARQVAEIPTLWRLEPLEQSASNLMAAAQNEQERQAVREFAGRVDRFAAIANRYKLVRGAPPQVALTRQSTPGPTAGATPPITPIDSGYDAVGVLRPVVSKRPNAPQFALVDERGKIVSFITARPDMNLTPMVGQRVGVQGVKGFMPEYQHQHVSAERVAQLDTLTR